MSHVRQQIRERVGTILTGLSTTGNNVFQSRVYALSEANLPALVIYSKSETSNADVIGTTIGLMRELTIVVEGYVKVNTDFDDVVDTICAEVETAMANDRTLNGTCKFNHLESTDIEFNGEGENPVGVATMNFIVQYRTITNAPETAV